MSLHYGSPSQKNGMIFAWFKANQRWDQKKPTYPIQRSLFLMNTSENTVTIILKVFFYRMGIATKRMKIRNKEYPIGSPYPIIDSPLTLDEVKINFGKTSMDTFTEGFNPKKTFSELLYAQTILDEFGNKGYEFHIKLEPTGHDEITLGPFYWLPQVNELGLLITPYIEIFNKESYHVLEENLVYVLSSPETGAEERLKIHSEMQESDDLGALEHRTVWIKRSFEPNFLWYFVDLTPHQNSLFLRHRFEFHIDDILQAQYIRSLYALNFEVKQGQAFITQLFNLIQTYLIGVNDTSIQEMLRDFQELLMNTHESSPENTGSEENLSNVLMEELHLIDSMEENPESIGLLEQEEFEQDLRESLDFELDALNELYDDKLFDDTSVRGENKDPLYQFLKKHAFTLYFFFLMFRTHRKFHEHSTPIQAFLWSLYVKNIVPFNVIQAWDTMLRLTQNIDVFFPVTTLEYSKTFELDWVPELFVNALLYHVNEGKEALKILQKQIGYEATMITGGIDENDLRIPRSIAWTTDDTQEAISLVMEFMNALHVFYSGTQETRVFHETTDIEFHDYESIRFIQEFDFKQKQYFLETLTQIGFIEEENWNKEEETLEKRNKEYFQEFQRVLQEAEFHELYVYDEFLVNLHHAIAMSFITVDGSHVQKISTKLSSMFIEKLITLYYPVVYFKGVTLDGIIANLKDLLDDLKDLTPENMHEFPVKSFIKLFEVFSFYSDKPYALTKEPIIFSRPVSIDGVKNYYKDLQFFIPKIIARQAHFILYKLFILLNSLQNKKSVGIDIANGESLIAFIRTFEALPHLLGRSNEGLNALYEVLKEIGIEEPTESYLDESIELESPSIPFTMDVNEIVQDKELSLEQVLLLTSKALLSRSRFFKRQKKLTAELVQYILNTFNKYNFEQKLLRELKQILPYVQESYRNEVAKLQVKLIQELKIQTTQTLATWELIQNIRNFIYRGQEFNAIPEKNTKTMINDLESELRFRKKTNRFSNLEIQNLHGIIKSLLHTMKDVKELVSFGPWEAPHELIHIVLYRILQYLGAIGETLIYDSHEKKSKHALLTTKEINTMIRIHKLLLEVLEYMDFPWFDENIERYLQVTITEFTLQKNNYDLYSELGILDQNIGSHFILTSKILYAYMREYLLSEGKSVLLLLNEMYLNAAELNIKEENLYKQKRIDRLFHELFSIETTSQLTRKALDLKIEATMKLMTSERKIKTRLLQQAKKILNIFNFEHAILLQKLFALESKE